jgi:hypothetical protein
MDAWFFVAFLFNDAVLFFLARFPVKGLSHEIDQTNFYKNLQY